MLASRTDVQDGGPTAIAASPILLLWSPPSPVEKLIVLDEERPVLDWPGTRSQPRPPVIAKAATQSWSGVALVPCQPTLRDPAPEQVSPAEWLARLRDVGVALALLVLCLPLMLMLALIIALSDGGPPVFAHTRIGRHGKSFQCYKLRSMHRHAESRLEALLRDNPGLRREWLHNRKLTRDPRVTWFGAFLRKSSLDELPQLFNLINGTMTLVGPRPIVEEELERYGRHAGCYLQCRPGLTGVWQVSGRSDTSYRRRVAADRLYLRRRSFLFDWKLLICTVPAVLTRKGAC
ncbi:sugar transferase [Novosphingobium rosa]|uniref:sugar transferase n=1 Tax=Novosphingobium rosa TaxID=76978 RepID=UPI000A0067E8|nr:sugar transferase [Novosphingobium rosa]